MTKKKNETQTEVNPSVCYIRVGEYCACYYKTKYDGEPIVFSDNDPLGMIVEENICSNPGLKLLTKHSYSWMAYHYNHEGQIFDVNVASPDPDEHNDFIGIQLPEIVHRRGKQQKTSSNWQLSKVGAERFRKQMKKEFWSALRDFIRTCKNHAIANGEDVTTEACISDFMLMYNIPMSHFENILKSEQRVRRRLRPETACQRDFIEQKTGNIFFYT